MKAKVFFLSILMAVSASVAEVGLSSVASTASSVAK